MNQEHTLIIAFGSNLGNREKTINKAIACLKEDHVLNLKDVRVSSMIETPALLPENAPASWDLPFLNGVISAHCTVKDPHNILSQLKAIEQKLGRKDRGHWSPREIDLDIIAYGTLHFHDENLTIPHPRAHSRTFVMTPLRELHPDWIF
jgi:2-amino-4-hydroxy-6-hydroxymethyldihydropteridine diphosphokinase